MSEHDELFARLAVYPLPEFPGRTQEGLLGQLLRKKLEPGVEDWVQEGLTTAKSLGASESRPGSPTAEDFTELWAWVGEATQEAYRKYQPIFGTDFTLDEREMGTENVVTGLKRKLDTGESDEDDESEEEAVEEDVMEIVDIHRRPSGIGIEIDVRQDTTMAGEGKFPIPLNDQFRFVMTGGLSK